MSHCTDLAQMARDIEGFCRAVDAPYDRQIVTSTLDAFAPGFSCYPVELRTTTRPVGQREVSFRYVEFGSDEDPFQRALHRGMLTLQDRPVDRLLPEMRSLFPILGYGVDASAGVGLEKIWPFLAKFFPIEDAFCLSSLPASVRASEPFLRAHRLSHFSIVAADFRHETANLYFPLRDPFFYTPERIGAMLVDAGFSLPAPEVLAYNSRAVFANITYSWRDAAIQRICFYVPAPGLEALPQDPVVRGLAASAPTLGPSPMFIPGYTFARSGDYIKLEVDYTGTIMGVLIACTMLEEVEYGTTEHSLAQAEVAKYRVVVHDGAANTWSRYGSGVALPALHGSVTRAPALLKDASSDFGGIVQREPGAVARPEGVADIVALVRFARANRIPISMRGQGHSAFGQAQVDGGIVIDSRSFARIHAVGADRAVVDSGVTWRTLVNRTLPAAAPPVLTDYLDLSVGGVLSVGGIGGTTQTHGSVADTVLALDVVTGDGELVHCSLTENRAIFESVLGGLGQFGFIVRATLALAPAPPFVRVYRLFYSTLPAYLDAQRAALRSERFLFLEGQVVPGDGRRMDFVLEAAQPFTQSGPPDDAAMTQDLNPSRQETMDLPYAVFLNRVGPFAQQWKAAGRWHSPHPWFDVFVPDRSVEALVSEALQTLTPEDLGAGVTLLYPFFRSHFKRPFLMLPDEPMIWLFDLLRFPPNDAAIAGEQLKQNRRLFERARESGATRYPISAIPFDSDDWRRHFGAQWELFCTRKKTLDPAGILTPGQGIQIGSV